MEYIKRFLRWQCGFLFSLYAPVLFTFIFAMLQAYFFPDSPIWPVGVFALFMVVIVTRYVKW